MTEFEKHARRQFDAWFERHLAKRQKAVDRLQRLVLRRRQRCTQIALCAILVPPLLFWALAGIVSELVGGYGTPSSEPTDSAAELLE